MNNNSYIGDFETEWKKDPSNSTVTIQTWEEEFDKEFPTKTIGHHHYVRERNLRKFIANLLTKYKEELLSKMPKKRCYEDCVKGSEEQLQNRINFGYNICLDEINKIIKES